MAASKKAAQSRAAKKSRRVQKQVRARKKKEEVCEVPGAEPVAEIVQPAPSRFSGRDYWRAAGVLIGILGVFLVPADVIYSGPPCSGEGDNLRCVQVAKDTAVIAAGLILAIGPTFFKMFRRPA